MPSDSFAEYAKNLKDVRRLIAAHKRETSTKPGKRGLGHYTRGGLLLLCASWERYVESVIDEAAHFLCARLTDVTQLPIQPQKKTRDHANSNHTAWTTTDVNSPKWKDVYRDALRIQIQALHSPKHEKINPLFLTFLGIANIEDAWSGGKAGIDQFVADRGEVAHRGSESKYVRFGKLVSACELVDSYVTQTDNYLSDFLRTRVNPNKRPWKRSL